MRILKVVLAIVGLVVIAWSIHHIGWAPVLEALARLTWWQIVLVCLPYAAIMAVDTLGWRFAFPGDAAPFHRLFGARLAGEALNLVTAVGSVGGEAVKAWLIRRDVAYAESVPSVVIAKTTMTIAQALFLLVGGALAWTMPAADSRLITAMLWLLLVEVAAVAGFVAVRSWGWSAEPAPARVVRRRAARRICPGSDAALRDYYRRLAAPSSRPASTSPAGCWARSRRISSSLPRHLRRPRDRDRHRGWAQACGSPPSWSPRPRRIRERERGAFEAMGLEPAPASRSASSGGRARSRGSASVWWSWCRWVACEAAEPRPPSRPTSSTST
jgi:hypothetical protein